MAYKTNFKNTIWAGAANSAFAHADVHEGVNDSGVSVRPGQLVSLSPSGFVTAGPLTNFANVMVVLEDGSDVGGTVLDAFADGEQIKAAFPRSGELFNLRVAGSVGVVPGFLFGHDGINVTPLSALDGTEQAVFMAMEESTSAAPRLVLFKAL